MPTTMMGPTTFERSAQNLAGAATRRETLIRGGKVIGAALAASLGLQVARPVTALGHGLCKYCGPSPVCPHGCCTSGTCAGGCDPTGYTWHVCYAGNHYKCTDCYSPTVCICVKYLGSCSC